MRVDTRHDPSFTVARCVLSGGEAVRVESGAMIAHSAGVTLESKSQGGLMAGLKRSVLGGGSFFVTTYTAPPQGGWVDVAGVLPGDTVPIDVTPDMPFFLPAGRGSRTPPASRSTPSGAAWPTCSAARAASASARPATARRSCRSTAPWT